MSPLSAKKAKFFPPPDNLTDVLVSDGVFLNKKKKGPKLIRRLHTPSIHVLDLKKDLALVPKQEVSVDLKKWQEKTAPALGSFDINVDAEKVHHTLSKFFKRWRSAFAFLGLGLIFILVLEAVNWIVDTRRSDYAVLARGTAGLNLLKEGANLLFSNPEKASFKFQSSANNFLFAQSDVAKLNQYHLKLLGQKKIDAALETARALKNLSQGVSALANGDFSLMERINVAKQAFVRARANVVLVRSREPARREIKELQGLIDEQLLLLEDIGVLLGRDQWKRYLLLFQNNTELRATGGFIGSFAVLDVDRGEIKNLEIPRGGSYDVQGQLKVAMAPPKPLQLVKSRWEFQDANWFPDFPTSAAKVAWFYAKAAGRTVDGVVAINTNLLIDLLKITGPIAMPKYRRLISADNFLLEAQKIVELEYDRQINHPKEFIGDLASVILEKLKNTRQDEQKLLFNILLDNLEKKNILLYAADLKTEKHLNQFGWGGRLRELGENEDYLGIIHTNIAGQKTDQSIKETVLYEPVIAPDGSVEVTLQISRTHEGKKGELFRGVRNVDFMRVYVPLGATFLSAQGFEVPPAYLFKDPIKDLGQDKNVVAEEETFAVDLASQTLIYNQFRKTVFANWLQVDPGETVVATLRYRLPFKLKNHYNLFIEKQSGSRPPLINLRPRYAKNETALASDQAIQDLQFILERDKKVEILLQSKN